MKKQRKDRSKPGKFITQNKLPKENPNFDEISKGQKENDVQSVSSSSPYWDWMEKHGQQTEDGDIIESSYANPDVLGDGQSVSSNNTSVIFEQLNTILTENQFEVMRMFLNGNSLQEIADKLVLNIEGVKELYKQAEKKIQKYYRQNG